MKINDIESPKAEPVTIRLPIINPSPFYKLLVRLKLKKNSYDFVIHRLTIGTASRISELINGINPGSLSDNAKLLQQTNALIEQHQTTIATIIALAIRNHPGNPPKSLVKYLMQNMTIANMQTALDIVIQQMDMTGFLQALVTLKGLNILSIEPN